MSSTDSLLQLSVQRSPRISVTCRALQLCLTRNQSLSRFLSSAQINSGTKSNPCRSFLWIARIHPAQNQSPKSFRHKINLCGSFAGSPKSVRHIIDLCCSLSERPNHSRTDPWSEKASGIHGEQRKRMGRLPGSSLFPANGRSVFLVRASAN